MVHTCLPSAHTHRKSHLHRYSWAISNGLMNWVNVQINTHRTTNGNETDSVVITHWHIEWISWNNILTYFLHIVIAKVIIYRHRSILIKLILRATQQRVRCYRAENETIRVWANACVWTVRSRRWLNNILWRWAATFETFIKDTQTQTHMTGHIDSFTAIAHNTYIRTQYRISRQPAACYVPDSVHVSSNSLETELHSYYFFAILWRAAQITDYWMNESKLNLIRTLFSILISMEFL